MIFFSCKKEESCLDKEVNKGIIESNYDFGKCFYFLDSQNYIINNIKEYQYLVDQIDSATAASVFEDCSNYELYSIDFSNITLLAQYAEGIGCEVGFEREVTVNEINKIYTYNINVYECGSCSTREVSMNWIQVPKLPEGYSVVFNVSHK